MRIALALLLLLVRVADPKIQVAPDVESGIYEPGKTVTWNVEVKDGDAPAAGKITYVVRSGGIGEAAKGDVELKEGKAQVTGTRATPGVLHPVGRRVADDADAVALLELQRRGLLRPGEQQTGEQNSCHGSGPSCLLQGNSH